MNELLDLKVTINRAITFRKSIEKNTIIYKRKKDGSLVPRENPALDAYLREMKHLRVILSVNKEISLETVTKIINDIYYSYDIQAQGLSK